MVLIFSILACIKSPSVPATRENVTNLPAVAILDRESETLPVPKELEEAISSQLRKQNISLQFTDLSSQFDGIRETNNRLALLTQDQVLLIEAQASFFSQLNGQFRWETSFDIYLKTNGEIKEKHLDIPVFLIYHHQREADALLGAETVLMREIEQFLDDNLSEK